MEFRKEVTFINCISKTSKKTGNVYFVLSLMEGENVFQVLSDNPISGEMGKTFIGQFELNIKFGSLKLKAVVDKL